MCCFNSNEITTPSKHKICVQKENECLEIKNEWKCTECCSQHTSVINTRVAISLFIFSILVKITIYTLLHYKSYFKVCLELSKFRISNTIFDLPRIKSSHPSFEVFDEWRLMFILLYFILAHIVADMSQSCTMLSHAVSMPALTCSSCIQQRHENDRLRLDSSKLQRDLKTTKSLLESSLKSEKNLRDRSV